MEQYHQEQSLQELRLLQQSEAALKAQLAQLQLMLADSGHTKTQLTLDKADLLHRIQEKDAALAAQIMLRNKQALLHAEALSARAGSQPKVLSAFLALDATVEPVAQESPLERGFVSGQHFKQAQERIQQLESQSREWQSKASLLNQDCTRLKQELESVTILLKTREEEFQAKKINQQTAFANATKLTQQLEERELKFAQQQADLKSFKAQSALMQTELAACCAELAKSKQEFNRQRQQHCDQSSSLREQLELTKLALGTYQKKIQESGIQLAEEKSKAVQMGARLAQHIRRLEKAQEARTALQAEKEQLQSDLKVALKELEDSTLEVESLDKALFQSNQNNSQLTVRVHQLQQIVLNLNNKLAVEAQALVLLQTQHQELNTSKAVIAKNLEQSIARGLAHDQALTVLRAKLEEEGKCAFSLGKQVQQLKEQLLKSAEQHQQQIAETATTRASLQKQSQQLLQLKRENDANIKLIEVMRKEIKTLRQECASLTLSRSSESRNKEETEGALRKALRMIGARTIFSQLQRLHRQGINSVFRQARVTVFQVESSQKSTALKAVQQSLKGCEEELERTRVQLQTAKNALTKMQSGGGQVMQLDNQISRISHREDNERAEEENELLSGLAQLSKLQTEIEDLRRLNQRYLSKIVEMTALAAMAQDQQL